jgi:selenocysteine lyase/cysteine desulfurase
MLSVDGLRKKFPIFKSNQELVYLDSASTTQKPQIRLLIEIEEISSFDRFKSANISGIIEFSKA